MAQPWPVSLAIANGDDDYEDDDIQNTETLEIYCHLYADFIINLVSEDKSLQNGSLHWMSPETNTHAIDNDNDDDDYCHRNVKTWSMKMMWRCVVHSVRDADGTPDSIFIARSYWLYFFFFSISISRRSENRNRIESKKKKKKLTAIPLTFLVSRPPPHRTSQTRNSFFSSSFFSIFTWKIAFDLLSLRASSSSAFYGNVSREVICRRP